MSNLPAVSAIEDRNRKGPIPARKYTLSEQFLPASLFPVIGKYRLVAGQKTPHQEQIAIVIHAHAHDFQSLRRILLCQLIQHGILVAAGFAPRRPKRNEQRFPSVLLDHFLISLYVDHLRIAWSHGLRDLRRGQRRRRQQNKRDKTNLDSHRQSFHSHSIHTLAG